MLWQKVQTEIKNIQSDGYHKILEGLQSYIKNAHTVIRKPILPIAVILTGKFNLIFLHFVYNNIGNSFAGINQPDHLAQFVTISEKINKSDYCQVIILKARDCPNMKNTIELITSSFIESVSNNGENTIRKSNCTIEVLKSWYRDRYNEHLSPNLTIVIPDFECFNSNVLQELIIILRSVLFGNSSNLNSIDFLNDTVRTVRNYHLY